METVSEFKVITNSISAEYGPDLRLAPWNWLRKAGTNAYSDGQLFEYMQNDKFNAELMGAEHAGRGRKSISRRDNYGGVVWAARCCCRKSTADGIAPSLACSDSMDPRSDTAGIDRITLSVPTELERGRKGDFSQTFYNGVRPMFYDQNGPVVYDSAKEHLPEDAIDRRRPAYPRLSMISPSSARRS